MRVIDLKGNLNRVCCPHPFSDATMTGLTTFNDVLPRKTEGDTFNKFHCPLSHLSNYMQIKRAKSSSGLKALRHYLY